MAMGNSNRPNAGSRLLWTALLILPLLVAGPAQAKYASLIMDADSGRVLHSVNANTKNYPASLTKIMTLTMVFDALKTGSMTLKTRLSVSRRAAGQPPSKLGLREGNSITVRDAILALVTKSANDVAVVVAEALGGTESKFAAKMTSKARTMGMSNTTFRNASGLPNRGQLSTAHDMATLARVLLRDYGTYYSYFSTKQFTYGNARYGNHNGLLGNYEGTDGIKTGYIRASGFNLVASVRRNGTRLIGVVFGGRTGKSRDKHMVTLFDKGFAQIAKSVLAEVTPPIPMHRLGGAIPAPQQTAAIRNHRSATTGIVPPQAREASQRRLGQPIYDQGSTGETTKTPVGNWGIQVGAYATPDPAWNIATKAAATARHLLEGSGVIKVVPLAKKGGRKLYRAQILGISEQQARQSCTYLERKSINCMPLRMKEPLQLALSAG